jgi:hypothetical protein
MDPGRTFARFGWRTPRRAIATALSITVGLALIVPAATFGVADTLEVHRPGLRDVDTRNGKVLPSAAQRDAVAALSARAIWNDFGTPASLIRYGGYLATGIAGSNASTAARAWVTANKSLFRLSSVSTSSLETVNDSPLVGSDGHAVIFRQRFGSLPAAEDGLITVGIEGSGSQGWKVAYVSSSSAGTQAAPAVATISATAAWLAAAADIGRSLTAADISDVRDERGWTVFGVDGISELGRARLVALPRPGATVRAAWETWLTDVDGGESTAYRHFIDARSGAVLVRTNQVFQLADRHETADEVALQAPTTSVFQGQYADDTGAAVPDQDNQACTLEPGGHGPYTAPAGTESITVVAAAAVETNDIVVELFYQVPPTSDPAITTGRVASGDLLTSPETLMYDGSPASTVPAGMYYVRICPFPTPTVPPVPPYAYAGNVTISDEEANPFPFPPKWRYFRSNPKVDLSDTDVRKTGCFTPDRPLPTGCDFSVFSLAARAPWDHLVTANQPSFTTIGNQAATAEAWGSPLTPAENYRPVDLEREYVYDFENTWQDDKCFTPFIPGVGNDINPAIVSLFANHNRVHDWSYFLGFTERNFNMQVNNFGLTSPQRENDPEIGNAQAGAISGGAPTYLGRDPDARRRARHHQHVPLAAHRCRLLCALRGR